LFERFGMGVGGVCGEVVVLWVVCGVRGGWWVVWFVGGGGGRQDCMYH